MRLEKIKICNYRSFGTEQTIDVDDLTTIIGNNSAGKTAALYALNTIFSPYASERIINRSDFHLLPNEKPEDVEHLELYIEAVFSFPEASSVDCDSTTTPLFYQSMQVSSPQGLPYIRIRLEAKWDRSNNIEGAIDSNIYYITSPEDEEISDSNRKIANRKELDNIRVIYVPAVRDPSKQLKNVSGTMIHQILNIVNWSNDTKEHIQETINQLNQQFTEEKGVKVLKESISSQWKKYDPDDRYSNAKLRFNSTDIESSIKKSEIYFNPTVTEKDYTISDMGDGLRSLFYISMVNSILDVESSISDSWNEDDNNNAFTDCPPLLTIVAIEEPENHISPQLLGKTINNLKSIAEKKNSQVIMTSHSPAIVKRISPENIRHFRLDVNDMNTLVKRISLPSCEKDADQYKYVKEAVVAYPEIYFSKLVVLGEGDSEEIVIPKFFTAHNCSIDDNGISIVPLGGRYVNHFWRLLSDLEIPFVTILDLDRERDGGGWGRIKYALEQLIKVGRLKTSDLRIGRSKSLSRDELEDMHKWDVTDTDKMNKWIDKLEKYDIYYSNPLDIDFLMLEKIGDEYINSIGENEGPRIEVFEDSIKRRIKIQDLDRKKYQEIFSKRIVDDVHATLKENGGNGSTYTETQKELMIWYKYLFLQRGKPTTHRVVLSRLSDEELKKDTPKVLHKLIMNALNKLNLKD